MPAHEKDIHLIRRAQEGNVLALARLHDSYYQEIYPFFFYRVEDVGQAELLSSDVFTRMVARIGFFKPVDGAFLPWLHTLARSALLEDLLQSEEELAASLSSPTERSDPPEHLNLLALTLTPDVLKKAIFQLKPDEQEVLIGRVIEGRSSRAIARELRRSVAGIRSLLRKALIRLSAPNIHSTSGRPMSLASNLDAALSALIRGDHPQAIVLAYPDQADLLLQLLLTAQKVRQTTLPVPSTTAVMSSKTQLMSLLDQKRSNRLQQQQKIVDDLGASLRRGRGTHAILTVMILIVIFILLSTLTVSALESLPGSWLYPIKVTLQHLHILITPDPAEKRMLTEFYSLQREQDFKAAVDLKRLSPAEAQGTQTAQPIFMITPVTGD